MQTPLIQAVAAALLVVTTLTAAPVLGAGTTSELYTIDDDHELDNEEVIQEYKSGGVGNGSVHGLDMTLAVADKAGAVGLNEWKYVSGGRTFFKIDYNEEITRTVRIYIPEAYWTPRLKKGLAAEDADLTADFQSVRDGSYTAVTVTLDGPTEATWKIPGSTGFVAGIRSGLHDTINNSTRFELPSLTSGEDWQRVPRDRLSGNASTYPIQTNGSKYTIQYDAAASKQDEQWVPVQRCSADGSASVCYFEKDGQPDHIHLLSRTTDPPPVRYQKGTSASSSLGSSWNDIKRGFQNLKEDVSSAVPWG